MWDFVVDSEQQDFWFEDGEEMLVNIGLTLVVLAMLFTMLIDVLGVPFRVFFPRTVAWWDVRKKRIELNKLEQENLLLEQKKEALEKQKALEDFLREHNIS